MVAQEPPGSGQNPAYRWTRQRAEGPERGLLRVENALRRAAPTARSRHQLSEVKGGPSERAL